VEANEKGTIMDATFFELDNMRDSRYGEILVFKKAHIDVYNTTGVNDCPAEHWDALDVGEEVPRA